MSGLLELVSPIAGAIAILGGGWMVYLSTRPHSRLERLDYFTRYTQQLEDRVKLLEGQMQRMEESHLEQVAQSWSLLQSEKAEKHTAQAEVQRLRAQLAAIALEKP